GMGLVAVAEGVETSTQAEILGRIGCDLAQGYYLSRPMDADAVDDVLRTCPPSGARVPALPAKLWLAALRTRLRGGPAGPAWGGAAPAPGGQRTPGGEPTTRATRVMSAMPE